MSSVDDLLFSLIMLINKVTIRSIHIVCLIVLMSGRHFRITGAFTDVIGAAVGIAQDVVPVCSFSLSGFSIAQVEAAPAAAAITKPVGLARTSKRCA